MDYRYLATVENRVLKIIRNGETVVAFNRGKSGLAAASSFMQTHGIHSILCSSSLDENRNRGFQKMLTAALASVPAEKVAISNADLKRIRELCEKHGILQELKDLKIDVTSITD